MPFGFMIIDEDAVLSWLAYFPPAGNGIANQRKQLVKSFHRSLA